MSSAEKHPWTTHGMSRHPLYKIWKGVRLRVSDPHFTRYQGRGIQCCDRWESFENFYADMAQTWESGKELDRIDNNGDYTPENCRWVDHQSNCWNKQNNLMVVYQGKTMALAEAVFITGKVPLSTAYARVKNKGWDVDAALLTPKLYRRGEPFCVDGTTYPSMSAAATALGVSRQAIYQRMKRKPSRAHHLEAAA